MRAPRITAENLRNQVDVVSEEIRLNVLNRPYGGFPWIQLPPVLFDTFPNAHNGYGDFVELEPATVDDCAEFFDTYYAPGNAQCSPWRATSTSTTPRAGRASTSTTSRPGRRRSGRRSPSRRRAAERREAEPRRARAAARARGRLPAARPGRGPRRLPRPRAARLACSATARPPGCSAASCTSTGWSPTSPRAPGLMGPLDARDPDTFTITAVHPPAVDPDRVLDAARRGAGQARRRRPDRRGAGSPGRALVGGAAPGERPRHVPHARPRRPRAALRARGARRGAAGTARRRHPRAGAGRRGGAARRRRAAC